MSDYNENVIEFLRNQKTTTVTFTQGKYISKIKKLAQERPDECKITSEGDGVIVAHIPTKWVRISPPPKREISEEQKQKLRERLAEARRK